MDLQNFFERHEFSLKIDEENLLKEFLLDMDLALAKKNADHDMMPTHLFLPKQKITNEKAIVIDAGGTNFRSALVEFDENGAAHILDLEQKIMPGATREYSKKEFFDEIAQNLSRLKNRAKKIGFCFSYPMKITEDCDGILERMTKEIKVPELDGCKIGEELKKSLLKAGWSEIEKITLLNDTAAVLLSGAFYEKSHCATVGFVLGTGMNGAFCSENGEIIDCESGKFSKIPLSDFDKSLDEKTAFPKKSLIEKACSGLYLPLLTEEFFLKAKNEKIICERDFQRLVSILNQDGKFSIKMLCEISENPKKFLQSAKIQLKKNEIENNQSKNSKSEKNENSESENLESSLFDSILILRQIFDSVVLRAAKFASIILAADVIKSSGEKSQKNPVLIVCNGTTFFKVPNLKNNIEENLSALLKKRNLHFKICKIENDVLLGSAISVSA